MQRIMREIQHSFLTADQGDLKTAKLLMKVGAKVNHRNFRDQDSLLLAARNGHLRVTKLLIENGAEINANHFHISEIGGTALMGAARNGHLNVVQYLLSQGADAQITSLVRSETALMMATQTNQNTVSEFLLGYPMPINTQNREGNTALHFATKHQNLVITSQLIAQGAKCILNQQQISPLMIAARAGNVELTRLLVEAGCDVNTKDANGRNAFFSSSTEQCF